MPGEAPLIGIIMGSRSDWETMRHAAETLDALGVAYETKVVSAHRTPERLYDYAEARGARPQGDRRRRRRRRASAGHGRLDDPSAGARRAGRKPGAVRPRQPALHRPDAGGRAGGHAGDRQGRRGQCRPARRRDPRDHRRGAGGAARRMAAGPDRRGGRSPNDAGESIVPPGSTIGIIGGGQLGRMLAMAAAQLGYRTHIYAPDADSAAAEVARRLHPRRVRRRGRAGPLRRRASTSSPTSSRISRPRRWRDRRAVPLHRRVEALEIAQDRLSEKEFVAALGGRPAPFAAVDDRAGLDAALAEIGAPAILKTRRFGYDGKGQARIDGAGRGGRGLGGGRRRALGARGLHRVRRRILGPALPRRRWRDRLLGRAAQPCTTTAFSTRSTVPAGPELDAGDRAKAEALAAPDRRRARLCRRAGAASFSRSATRPIFNEMAPRVHNSGHWTIEGAVTSQFENHIRADLRAAAGRTDAHRAARRDAQSDRRRRGRLARDPRRSRRAPPPLRQERGPPRPQDGPRHPPAPES